MKNKELDLRKEKILEAIIRSYVEETTPVSSSFLVERYNFEWSSATIRNTMAQLEGEGLLRQPHTSSGRIPTDKGYRYYVDNIIKPKKPSSQKEILIRRQYDSRKKIEKLEDLIEKTAHVICAITNQAAIVMVPKITLNVFKKINLIQLDKNRMLVVLLDTSGMVKNIIINLPENIKFGELKKVENFLNDELKGFLLNSIKGYLLNKIKRHQDAVFNVINNACEIINLIDVTHINNKLFLNGLSLIMDKPEFKNFNKSCGILHVLEEKTEVLEIMNEDLEDFKNDIKVHIGSENIYEDIQHCSLIISRYQVDNHLKGNLGVIGPTRMAYDEVIPTLRCISHVLSNILSKGNFIETK